MLCRLSLSIKYIAIKSCTNFCFLGYLRGAKVRRTVAPLSGISYRMRRRQIFKFFMWAYGGQCPLTTPASFLLTPKRKEKKMALGDVLQKYLVSRTAPKTPKSCLHTCEKHLSVESAAALIALKCPISYLLVQFASLHYLFLQF
jgi:hypothetical protein